MKLMVPGSITEAAQPMLFTFINHFEAIPQIAAYTQSDNYIEHPINSPWASFS